MEQYIQNMLLCLFFPHINMELFEGVVDLSRYSVHLCGLSVNHLAILRFYYLFSFSLFLALN